MSFAFLSHRGAPFPPVHQATERGLVAVGGDASPERLLSAYHQGIFPWPQDRLPLLWYSPDPRFLLPLAKFRVGRSLKKSIASRDFQIRVDTAFEQTMRRCATQKRPGQDGTWIREDLVQGYTRLHELGYAHSIEAWTSNQLVGGLYGVSLGRAFFGESMFADVADASKVAFVSLAAQLTAWDFQFIDCQVHTEHLARFGAEEVSRSEFLAHLHTALSFETRASKWQLELSKTDVRRFASAQKP